MILMRYIIEDPVIKEINDQYDRYKYAYAVAREHDFHEQMRYYKRRIQELLDRQLEYLNTLDLKLIFDKNGIQTTVHKNKIVLL